MLCFHFHFSQDNFYFPFDLTHCLFRSMLLNLPYQGIFQFSCNYFPVSYHCGLEKILDRIPVFLNLLRLFCDLVCDLSWRIFHFLENVYSVAFGWNVLYISVGTIWSFSFHGVWNSPTRILLISYFRIITICFIHILGAPILGS